MRPILELIKTDFVVFFKLKVSYKSASTVLVGSFCSLVVLLLYIFFLGLFRDSAYLPPDFDLLIDIYFQELLLPQIVVLGAWYISAQKSNADRFREYKFLVSLPVTAKQIFIKFVVADCIRYLWIPTAFSVLYLGLLPLASIRFLTRPILFAFIFYFFMQSLLIFSHLSIVEKFKALRSFNYITKFNPLIIILSGTFYGVAQLLFLFAAKDLTPLSLALTNSILLISTILLTWRAGRLFLKLHENNFWVKDWGTQQEKTTDRRSIKLLTNWASKVKNPFLFKNLILLFRSNSKLINSGLTFAFIGVAYLLAMNNIALADSLTVLFACTVTYILLNNIVALNRLNQNEESSKILFSLPATKSRLYFSLFIPIGSGLIVTVSLLTFWLSLKGFPMSDLASFWLNLCIAILVALVIALNSGLGNYPDTKLARNHYLFWFFVIIVCSAVFYKFRILIALTISLVTFIELRKLKLFQSC